MFKLAHGLKKNLTLLIRNKDAKETKSYYNDTYNFSQHFLIISQVEMNIYMHKSTI